MIPVAFEELEALALGRLEHPPADGVVRRIHDDSRTARPGDLFVALNTGVAFVDDAARRGASTLVPDDQEAALAALASFLRDRTEARVVAVVGSTGKTSTKDALAALCDAVVPTVAASASRNNELGLPLTVLQVEPETEVLVTEMGMRGHGQIAALCAIARPDVVLVTSIGPEHLELVGSVEDVARTNAEAIEALPTLGIAIAPVEAVELEPYLERAANRGVRIVRFDRSMVERTAGRASAMAASNSPLRALSSRWRFRVPPVGAGAGTGTGTGTVAEVSVGGKAAGGGEVEGAREAGSREERVIELELPFDQRHLAENVLGALTAYRALGFPLERAQEGASRIQLSRWRGEVLPLPGGGLVVNDAYNANPTSMRAALVDLVERADGRRTVAILGEMAELGAAAGRYHGEIAALLGELGIDVVVGVGEPARAYLADSAAETHWLPDAAAFPTMLDVLRPGDAVLVKASRAVGLEGIPSSIENHARAWSVS